jgi:parvulin-like peptidyl-prolyl isomerase
MSKSAANGAILMRRTAILASLLLAAFAGLGLVGCGSEKESVPPNAVAVVGDETITKEQFDRLIEQARGSYRQQKRAFPKPGSQEYQTLRGQAMQFLVQRAQFEQKAEELDIEVTDEDVDKRLVQLKKQYFQGSEKKYEDQLREQGLSEEQVKDDIRAQLIQEKIYAEVTKGAKVTDKEIDASYKKNKSQYVQPATREVRHILVGPKKKALADQLYAQLQDGANFAALAKQHSEDPSSKSQGGKLTISRGQTVPPFDGAAFSLVTRALSKPIRTQYGWHIIQPLGPVKKSKTTPLGQVKQAIRQQLLQEKKQKEMTAWVNGIRKDFAKDTTYQVGYKPAETGTTAVPQQ